MSQNENNSNSSRAPKIAAAIGAGLCLFFLTYACEQKKGAEEARQFIGAHTQFSESLQRECQKSNRALQLEIDSLRLQVENFESRMNRTEFSDYVYSDSTEGD